jgi:regulatory protein
MSPGSRPTRERRGAAARPKSCHDRALGLLAVRARSRRELEHRLLQAGFGSDEVTEELVRLERVGLIDDSAFARQVAAHEFGVRRSGRRVVAGALAAKGVAPAIVGEIVGELDADETERVQALARSRASRMTSLEPAKAYARLTSFLVRRGYDPALARDAARRALDVETARIEP